MDAHALLPPIIRFYRTRRRMPSLRGSVRNHPNLYL